MSQKNFEVRLNFANHGALSVIQGAILSAPKCAIAVTPNPTVMTLSVSVKSGMRSIWAR